MFAATIDGLCARTHQPIHRVQAAYDLAERVAERGFNDGAHALRWLWKSEVAGSRDRRQNLRNVLREINANADMKALLEAEEDFAYGGGAGATVDAEGGSAPMTAAAAAAASNDVFDEFLAALDEHKKITVRKLSTTAEDAQLRRSFTEEVAQREKKLKDDYKELSDELNSLKQRREDEVGRWAAVGGRGRGVVGAYACGRGYVRGRLR